MLTWNINTKNSQQLLENSVLRYLNNDGEVVEDDDDSFCYYECRFVIDEVNHVTMVSHGPKRVIL